MVLPGYGFTDLVTLCQLFRALKDSVVEAIPEYGRFVDELDELKETLESLGDAGTLQLGKSYAETVKACGEFIDKHVVLKNALKQRGNTWQSFQRVYKQVTWQNEARTVRTLRQRIDHSVRIATMYV